MVVNKKGFKRIKVDLIVFVMGCRERIRGVIIISGIRLVGIFIVG